MTTFNDLPKSLKAALDLLNHAVGPNAASEAADWLDAHLVPSRVGNISAREAARRGMALDGADARALEGALQLVEKELEAEKREKLEWMSSVALVYGIQEAARTHGIPEATLLKWYEEATQHCSWGGVRKEHKDNPSRLQAVILELSHLRNQIFEIGTNSNAEDVSRHLEQESDERIPEMRGTVLTKPLIYIAGPFRGAEIHNIRNAVRWGDSIAKQGGIPFVPHTHGALFEFIERKDDDFWLDHGLAMVARCDGLLRIPGKSSGADAEAERARELGIPVWIVHGPGQGSFASWLEYCGSLAREHDSYIRQRAEFEKVTK